MAEQAPKRVRTRHFQSAKESGIKITGLTSYDQLTAGIFDEAGIDFLLVGDSAGNNVYGYDTTLPVSVDDLIPLARAVAGAVKRAFVVADMPFGSYETSPDEALHTAFRFMKETGAHAVKLEGGVRSAEQIRRIVSAGIPVMAHIGFTPQSEHGLGGHVIQGRGAQVEQLLADAHAVEDAGAFAVVLEMVPSEAAARVTKELTIPTIGVGAGPHVDGQLLVWTDWAGFTKGRIPKFVKQYADLRGTLTSAVLAYRGDVEQGSYPGPEHSYEDSNMTGRVYVGMAGWTYADWRGSFYPKGLVQKNELAWASTQVTSIELNGSFYSLQKPPSWIAWRDATHETFIFSVKAPRFITHIRRLDDVAEPLANFFASGLLALGRKLGPILWQLPPSQEFEPYLIEQFFALLPHTTTEAVELAQNRGGRMSGREYLVTDAERPVRHAIEVRHHSFGHPDVIDLARKYGVAVVYGDSAGKWPVIDEATTDFRYARLHADESKYPGGFYEPADLELWASTIRGWNDSGLDAYVYFDNDTKVRAPHDAMSLIALLS